MIFLYCQ